jgi:hypothetical protein
MTIDKSLRQNYQIGKKVDAFKEQFKNIAGKAGDTLTSGFAPDETTKEQKTLGDLVKSQAKSYATNKLTGAVLGKLGLGSLVPYVGILSFLASKLGYKPSDLMTGYTSGFMPGQTQAQYEAARAARQKQARIDNMLARRGAGKDYSQQNLNELTLGSRPGFYGNVPTYDLGMYQGIKTKVPKTPTVITPHGPDEVVKGPVTTAIAPPSILAREGDKTDKGPISKDFSFEDAKVAAQKKAAKDAADKAAADRAAAKSRKAALEAMRGGVGRNGGGHGGGGYGGGGQGAPGGQGGWKGAKGGYVDRPLPGGNKYL